MGAHLVVGEPPLAEPGGVTACTVQVHNTSPLVESWTFDVLGDAAAWATFHPPEVRLFPGESGSTTVSFHVPASHDVRPGPVPFAVRATPTSGSAEVVIEEGVLHVAGYTATEAVIRPKRARKRRRSQHVVTVANHGNEDAGYQVHGYDEDEALDVQVDPAAVSVPGGTAAEVKVRVRAHEGVGFGREHKPFRVDLVDHRGQVTTLDAALDQRGLPRTLLLLPVALAALVVGALVLLDGGDSARTGVAELAADQSTDGRPGSGGGDGGTGTGGGDGTPGGPGGGGEQDEQPGGDGGRAGASSTTKATISATTSTAPPADPVAVAYLKKVGTVLQVFTNTAKLDAERQATAEPGGAGSPSLSADRKAVVYSAAGKVRVIAAAPAAPGVGRDLAAGVNPAFSHDGTTVLFWLRTNTCAPRQPCLPSFAIHRVGLAEPAGAPTRVSANEIGAGSAPATAKDGTVIYSIANRIKKVVDPSTSTVLRQDTTEPKDDGFADPTFVGSGNDYAYGFRSGAAGSFRLAATLSSGLPARGTFPPGSQPASRRDGRLAAFNTSTASGEGDICLRPSFTSSSGEVCTKGGGRRDPSV